MAFYRFIFRFVFRVLAFAAILSIASIEPASAARIQSSCRMKAGDLKSITGSSINDRLPIASVSKVMTSWWIISSRGLRYRFETKFRVTPLEDGRYDVHIEGSRDPYFGKESLHFAISELNRYGVKNIRRLTFDENFKFFCDITSSGVAQGFYTPRSPVPSRVLSELKSMKSLTDGYDATYKRASARKIAMLKEPVFVTEEISFKSQADALELETSAATLVMHSAPLQVLLKEMNRNSNNHAANQIFEHLGGAEAFQAHALAALGLDETDLRFLNGSGDRVDLPTGKAYNEATCGATLKIIDSLKTLLSKENRSLEHVLAVIGRDTSSTPHKLYNNSLTAGSVMAKTGTVNPSVTLGGLAHTKTGPYIFMFNAKTTGGSDWSSGRNLIRTNLLSMMRALGGGKPFQYSTPASFLSFDAHSRFASQVFIPGGR